MKIAVLGTRGIPNRYGGFEQAAENLSMMWNILGHEVTVYNPDDHPYKDKTWNGVKIKQICSNEKRFGVVGTSIFDYLCLSDALNQDYDVVFELGCSASVFYQSKNKRDFKIITNMDGLEWKRSKWNKITRKFLEYLEMQAVLKSDALIADNPGIQDFLKNKYNADSYYIPYGADVFENPNMKVLEGIEQEPYSYFLLVARFEPENNIEMILDGYIQSKSKEPFFVVGNYKTKYGNVLVDKYKKYPLIIFLGSIYNFMTLNNIRYFSKIYFHGHSVGGTNPSLLEAMGCSCCIAAHNNAFNRYVLGEDSYYFNNSNDVAHIINSYAENCREYYVQNNKIKIKINYNWKSISKQYLEILINH